MPGLLSAFSSPLFLPRTVASRSCWTAFVSRPVAPCVGERFHQFAHSRVIRLCPPALMSTSAEDSASRTAYTTAAASDIARLNPAARFSQIVKHGGLVYLSGQLAPPELRCAGMRAQTEAALARIDALLTEAGTHKGRMLSATVWITDVSLVHEMNEAWDAWLDKDAMPTRATVQSALVVPDALVEIKVVAAAQRIASAPRALPIATPEAAAAVGPYSQGVAVDDGTVYVSGCIGLRASDGTMAGNTVKQQTEQALSNLRAVLKAAGCVPGDIVKTTILLDDMADFAEVNEIYAAFFEGGRVPARSCFAAKTLPKGALVEVEAIAMQRR